MSLSALLFAQDGFRTVKTLSGGDGGIDFREVERTTNRRTFEYMVDPISVSSSNRAGYSALELSDVENRAIPGEPSMPIVSQRFIVPAGMILDSISVLPSESSVQTLEAPITYGEEFISDENGVNSAITAKNDALYRSTALYPANIAELVTVQKQSGVSIAFLNLAPYQFRGAGNKLVSTKSFNVTFHYSPETVSRSGSISAAYPDRVDTDLLGVENPSDIEGYQRRSRSGSQPEAQYLILTSKAFLNANEAFTVNDLAERRRSQGMTVKIVTVDSIYANVNSSLDWAPNGVIDNPAKIRYFLHDAYYNKNWGMEYVMIAGDTNVVPVRMLSPRMRYFRNDITDDPAQTDSITYVHTFLPSDYYYQSLDGIYNAPLSQTIWAKVPRLMDRWWGSRYCGSETEKKLVDILPEFAIGRVPAGDAHEFSNWVSKQFIYENESHAEEANRTFLFAGEKLGFYYPGHDAFTAEKSLEEIRLGSEYRVSTKGVATIPEIKTEVMNETFIIDEVAKTFKSDKIWVLNDLLNRINSDEIGVINHLGHGLEQHVLKNTNADISSWKNTKPLFAYSQACLPGRFTKDCIVENLLTQHSTSGIWGGVFNTGVGYKDNSVSSSTDGPSHRLNRFFWHYYVNSEDRAVRLGSINDKAKLHSIDRAVIGDDQHLYVVYGSSVLGDPFSELRIANRDLSDYLYLTSPVGNNTVLLDKNQKITWHSTSSANVTLSLLTSNGTETAIGSASGTAGELAWTPSQFASTGNGFRIVIKNGTMTDTSAAFAISDAIALKLTDSPKGAVTKGDIVSISWESDDPATTVWLVRNGEPDTLLAESSGSGSIDWSVPMTQNADTKYTIRAIGSQSRNIPVESAPFSVVTGIVNQFPFIETFDDMPEGTTLPDHWEQLDSDNREWTINSGLTPTWDFLLNSGKFKRESLSTRVNFSGPTEDRTSGNGNYCFVDGRRNRGMHFQMTTPRLDLRGCTGTELSFWMHMFSNTLRRMGEFRVELIRDGEEDVLLYEQTEHETEYDTLALSQDGPFSTKELWQKKEFSLAEYEGAIVQIRFSGLAQHFQASDMAIDDIEVTVGNQAVSVLKENSKSTVVTDELIVVPSVVTSDVQISRIYHKTRKPFTFTWGLYNAVGDLLESGEGDYSGNGSAVDYIDVSRFRGYTGATVLFLKATAPDGKVTVHKTSVGFKK